MLYGLAFSLLSLLGGFPCLVLFILSPSGLSLVCFSLLGSEATHVVFAYYLVPLLFSRILLEFSLLVGLYFFKFLVLFGVVDALGLVVKLLASFPIMVFFAIPIVLHA